jgi:hypothetical protein
LAKYEYNYNDQFEKDEMGKDYSANGEDEDKSDIDVDRRKKEATTNKKTCVGSEY